MRLGASIVLAVVVATCPEVRAETSAKAWMGVGIEPGVAGVRVSEVIDGTPAYEVGLRVGDQILSIDRKRVATPSQLIALVGPHQAGDTIELWVERDRTRFRIDVDLVAMPSRNELLYRRLVGKPAPNFALTAVGPGSGKLGDLRGQVVVIEFWVTWCKPCMAATGALSELVRRHGDAGLVALAISAETVRVLRAYVDGKQPAFTVLRDPNNVVQKDYFVGVIPTIVVVDRDGIVVFAGMAEAARGGLSVADAIAANVADATFAIERALRKSESPRPRAPR
jgi:peroxiredoxin